MNIWYFHHYSTPDSMPGLHRPFEFGKYFVKNGHKLTIFTSSFLHYSSQNMIDGKDKMRIETYNDIKTVFVRTRAYSSSLKRIGNMFDFYKNVLKVAKSYAKQNGVPDIIIASSPHPLVMMAGNKLAKKFSIPCICEVRDFWPEVFFTSKMLKEKGLFGRYLLRKEKNTYIKASALLFLKEGDYNYIKEHRWDKESGGKIDMSKCYYVNNGVDLELFDKRMKECKLDNLSWKNDKFSIVYCGTIRPVNHVDILVDVAKELGDDYQIVIYGTGNCVEDIQTKIKQDNVKNVLLQGYIDNKYVPYILSNANASILNYSSTDYNWSRGNSSNKLFEYLASSRPVVSTVKMGYDILERFQCGFSSDDCSPKAIADCIRKVKNLDDKEYAKKCKNARFAAEHFDIKVLANKYLDVIENVISNFRKEIKNG